eukprot:gnl/MRDRNA2_/MRDRNA2_83373_c0_seq2.p1 gnl/MRDRNA2_/MRDRNA2_83373_c0~~gnl/MRDRNA2_/MRDRNA2_83373_c0_seq2.p1  ORF type:complete len:180 (+),score=17.40 gnl/MRDRNA2_/MRDRNA2_83373_c0_seq2:99-638(+)
MKNQDCVTCSKVVRAFICAIFIGHTVATLIGVIGADKEDINQEMCGKPECDMAGSGFDTASYIKGETIVVLVCAIIVDFGSMGTIFLGFWKAIGVSTAMNIIFPWASELWVVSNVAVVEAETEEMWGAVGALATVKFGVLIGGTCLFIMYGLTLRDCLPSETWRKILYCPGDTKNKRKT